MATIEQRIAENIKTVMDNKQVSVNALSEETGIPYNTIKRRLVDGRDLQVYELGAIANALDVTPYDLMGGRDAQPEQAA